MIQRLTHNFHFWNRESSQYHPLDIGLVESTNKELESIFKKTMQIFCTNWAMRLLEDISRAYRTTWTITPRFTPYELIYNKNSIFLNDFIINTNKTICRWDWILQNNINISYTNSMSLMSCGNLLCNKHLFFYINEENSMIHLLRRKHSK